MGITNAILNDNLEIVTLKNSAKINFRILLSILVICEIAFSGIYFIVFEKELKAVIGLISVTIVVAVFICVAMYWASPNLFKDKKSAANR